ncbi:hypothetical protein FF1_021738 [Malus domestica]|nr:pectinesterase inhibitor-like [Malus sylvestris]
MRKMCSVCNPSSICILIISFLVMTPSQAFDLNSICKQSMNPSFCSLLLSSNPRVTEALLRSLAGVTVDLGYSNTTATRDRIVKWKNQTSNPALRLRYTSCAGNYNEAVANFKEAKEKAKVGDYNGVRNAAAGALGEFNGCSENFKQPPSEPTSLWQDTRDLLNLSSIILIVSNTLLHK